MSPDVVNQSIGAISLLNNEGNCSKSAVTPRAVLAKEVWLDRNVVRRLQATMSSHPPYSAGKMFANMTAGAYRQETGQCKALSKSESAGLRQRPAPRRIHFGVLQLQVHMTLTRLPLAPDGSNTLSNVTGN